MAQLDFNTLFSSMLTAAKTSLADKWPAIRDLATSSFKTLAQNFVDIQQMLAAGSINQQQASLLLDMQKNTARTVMLSEQGLGILAVEAAINAALGAVATIVNTAIGFPII